MPEIVDREAWLTARRELLAEEKAFTRARDALAAKRMALPWVRIDADYRFQTESGEASLSELFAGKSQLIVYHFMLGPDWEAGCKSCSLITDQLQNLDGHLGARDTSLVLVSRAPLERIEAFKQRMGWSHRWVSSAGSAFNFDFDVSWTDEQQESGDVTYNFRPAKPFGSEGPGLSVFVSNDEGIFHSYSVYGRGLEDFMGIYRLLDTVPKGRDEAGLPYGMAWVKHRDRYDS